MPDHEIAKSSTTELLPVAPSLGMVLEAAHVPRRVRAGVDARVVFLSVLAVGLGLVAAVVAQGLTRLIGLITNLSFYGRFSTDLVSPAGHALGALVIVVPVLGALVVGVMARYGSAAIRGHGIPEAMEQILFHESRIPARITFLKPVSAAISIGTGGPFGAEGPIIATGGALGSVLGQVLSTTASERKALLAAGAAAGMAATFGSPVSAVLLALELLLFEYRPRSIIPVALASVAATAARIAMVGSDPVFAVADLTQPSGGSIAAYIALGAVVGVASVGVTKLVYGIEDLFAKLPVHWMWWPAIGAVAVGVVGFFEPLTMGVGYTNIEHLVSGTVIGWTAAVLCALKLVSWSVALGSGTSGGTLAPLFTLGAGLGSCLGLGLVAAFPGLGVDVRIAALVGMAAMFAGASRALLASVVFAFETTRQPFGLLPLLGGCGAAYLISCLMMEHSIMTEKIARRGVRVPSEYAVDFLDHVLAGTYASRDPVTVRAEDALALVRAWIAGKGPGTAHQGFPVVDAAGALAGVVTRRDLLDASVPDDRRIGDLVQRQALVVHEDDSLREAADVMSREGIGRLVLVSRGDPTRPVGMLTRSDILGAHRARLEGTHRAEGHLGRGLRRRRARRAQARADIV